MILRKTGLGAVIISLALLLSSCVEISGDISVNSAARFNGELTYTLDKSFAEAAGIPNLAALNSEASTSEDPIEFCLGVPFIEDSTNYILKCSLKDALAQSGDITASVVGSTIVFRYKANLDATSDQTNFGSVSLTVSFLDPIISYKENKVGLVKKVSNLTYLISGYATEPIDIEITANCSSRCGLTNPVPVPEPTKTASPTDTTSAAIDAANKAADAAAAEVKAIAEKLRDGTAETVPSTVAQLEAEVKAIAEKLRDGTADNSVADPKAQQEAAEKAAAEKAAADLKAAAAKVAAELKAAAEKIAADKSVAELKAMAEKAAAELKAKIAADKAAADLKAAADKAAAELKAVAEKAAADLKAAADKAAAEKVLADAKASAAKILADAKAKAAAALKKTTITCVKGKLMKKVTAVKPVCPKGYTKKK